MEIKQEESKLYQGEFKYIYVPAEITTPISEHSISKAGGLENDGLRLLAEKHFSGNASALSTTSVEIVGLLLPTPDYQFIGVSMYCDSIGKNKNLPINTRATSIAQLCNHKDPIHGDVFFGKFIDDESKPWIRLDFTMDDLNSDAEWLKIASIKMANRSTGYSTSSVLQNMLKQGNTQFIDPSTATTDNSNNSQQGGERNEGILHWKQDGDEIEIKIPLLISTIKSSDLDIKIKSSSLQIIPKSSGLSSPLVDLSKSTNPKVNQLFEKGGLELFHRIDVDSSSWQLDKTKDGKEIILSITLAKDANNVWFNLAK